MNRPLNRPLNVLIVEDSPDDSALLIAELRNAGYDPQWRRVETESEFLAALAQKPDIILSDHALPQFNGLHAAKLTRNSGLDIPFILVSGAMGEESAVEAMKSGATDYLLKYRLTRLGAAIERALRETQEHAARRQAQEELRASELKFRQLAENIREVFWITEPDKMRMLYLSPAYETIWARTCESVYLSPQSWLESIHPDDRDRILQATRLRREGKYDETYRILRPDGSVRWIHDRAFPVRNDAGEVYRIVGVAEDISDQRRLEEQFRQAQKMEAIGLLAGGIAHDFNNILAVIKLEADLIRADDRLPPTLQNNADEIGLAAERAAALTRQLLLFSRREMMQPHDLDLNQAINQTAKMLRRMVSENIQIQFRLSSQPLFLFADPGMLDQVLLNLAVNARDAMPRGGRLAIETSVADFDELTARQLANARPGSFAHLAVSDNGCGIPREHLNRIFEPFFTTKEVGKGTGLGLATVFGIVQQHRGWVDVYSESGQGTTFHIYLPLQTTKAAPKAAPSKLAELPGGTETLLLVEDNPHVRASVRAVLTRLGYRILEAGTGDEALAVWQQHHTEIKLLLTDLIMPGQVTGKELGQRLLEKNPNLKVIYASGYTAEIASRDFPLEEGVNFLPKPFPVPKLAQTIRTRLDG